jgi:hypothetical protein
VLRVILNVAIILALAAVVAVVPGGGDAADTVLTALTMGFLAAMAFFVYRLYRENSLTIDTLQDGRRALLFAAVGAIGLMIAWADEAFTEGGLAVLGWIAVMVLAVLTIAKVWIDATTYS